MSAEIGHTKASSVRTGWKARNRTFVKIAQNYQLYLLFFPTLLYFVIFQYGPMYGLQIAFKNFSPSKGIWNSPWVGLQHFERFFDSAQFIITLKNTLLISLYELVLFPIPVLLALLMNQLLSQKYKRVVQTIVYAPHFISMVVLVGMLYLFLNPRNGLINQGLVALGLDTVHFMADAVWFKSIFVWSNVWQNAGWGTIIYLAALTSINPELHEAAIMDGASKLQRILHIDIPGIMPTVMILLILNMGSFMTVGFEKAYLMQNPMNAQASEIIQTYVYKTGLVGAQFGYSAAIGLFNNVTNFIILIAMNSLAKRLKQASLW
ncbi:ABC transporter permease [Paenibacillus silviterrae]|uniref:ABC transporter permease n=1 Tax=Paenibacillus silviterrae TaxID=3242194 RepID=UPI0025433D43|nr:ABC transporter permease subunit [Paenibacillus chinjuensis]